MVIPAYFEQIFQVLYRELKYRILYVVIIFTVISILTILIGYQWPKVYESTTAIYADRKNIIRPLMRGVAENTVIFNKDHIVELIFSRRILSQVMVAGGWDTESMTPMEKERVIKQIKNRIKIQPKGQNIIRFRFADVDPKVAFQVTSKVAELFLAESMDSKKRESKEAFEFIDRQVQEYHKKLSSIEEDLKLFYEENIDSSPEGDGQAYSSIIWIKQRIEQAKLDLKEALIRQSSLMEQLREEAREQANSVTGHIYRQKIQELEDKLSLLRLSYHEDYPDIVHIKQQIEDMKLAILEEHRFLEEKKKLAVFEGESFLLDEGTVYSRLYQELRSKLVDAETEVQTFKTRIREMERMLQQEHKRAQRIREGQALEAELKRDYEVTQSIYQDLLRKRENARVSVHLDLEGKGVIYRIQEPANMPLVPSGFRFYHFLIVGPLLGLAVPIGLLILLVNFDPRIRFQSIFFDKLQLPFLGQVPHSDLAISRQEFFYSALLLTVVFVVYVSLGWLKFIS